MLNMFNYGNAALFMRRAARCHPGERFVWRLLEDAKTFYTKKAKYK